MQITVRGETAELAGRELKFKDEAPAARVYDLEGKELVVGMIAPKPQLFIIVPSLKTEVCSYGAKKFDELLGEIKNISTYIITADSAENIASFTDKTCLKNVTILMDKNLEFGKKYGVLINSGVLKDKLARSVFIADENGLIVFTHIVPEIVDEVDYDVCMEAVKKAVEPKPHDPHHNHENWMRH